ncbi:MAG: hypothetical protein VYE77_07850 [Planctomycetota bacterium]|nr:hypothetical protein [Planctomycetota bacterium]
MEMRKVVVATAILVPFISAGVVLGLPSMFDECWKRMERWSGYAEHAWAQRSFEREPLTGEPTDGSAFADYQDALLQAKGLGRDDETLLRRLRFDHEAVPLRECQDFALRWAAPLAALSSGAHRVDARPPVDWQKGFTHNGVTLLVARDLINASTIEVRRRLSQGDPLGAVRLSLDVATFEVDLLASPLLIDKMVACSLLTMTAEETWTDEALAGLDQPALELLATGLERLDARCPQVFDWRGESLLLANTIRHLEDGSSFLADREVPLKTMDYGWSERWAVADAVLQQVQLWEGLRTSGASCWRVRKQELQGLLDSSEVQGNPVLRVCFSNFIGAERSLRSALTVVRLLRLAVACRLGQELPELQDPLGEDQFESVSLDDGAVVFRSMGGASRNGAERVVNLR